MIIEWPLNGLFNDACDVIIILTDVFEVVDHGDDHDLSTFTWKHYSECFYDKQIFMMEFKKNQSRASLYQYLLLVRKLKLDLIAH